MKVKVKLNYVPVTSFDPFKSPPKWPHPQESRRCERELLDRDLGCDNGQGVGLSCVCLCVRMSE